MSESYNDKFKRLPEDKKEHIRRLWKAMPGDSGKEFVKGEVDRILKVPPGETINRNLPGIYSASGSVIGSRLGGIPGGVAGAALGGFIGKGMQKAHLKQTPDLREMVNEGAISGMSDAVIPFGAGIAKRGLKEMVVPASKVGTNLSTKALNLAVDEPLERAGAMFQSAKRFLSLGTEDGPIQIAKKKYLDFLGKRGVTGIGDAFKEEGVIKTAEGVNVLSTYYGLAEDVTKQIMSGKQRIMVGGKVVSPQMVDQILVRGIQAGNRLTATKKIAPDNLPQLGALNLERLSFMRDSAELRMPGFSQISKQYGKAIDFETMTKMFPRKGFRGDVKSPSTGYLGAVALGGVAGAAGYGADPMTNALTVLGLGSTMFSPRINSGLLSGAGAGINMARFSNPVAGQFGVKNLLQQALSQE